MPSKSGLLKRNVKQTLPLEIKKMNIKKEILPQTGIKL